MFNKFFIATTLVGSALVSGATASAGDFARETPAPPKPPVVSVDGFTTPEQPGYSAYTITCVASAPCESLQKWCAKNGGTYNDHTGRDGDTHGVCSG